MAASGWFWRRYQRPTAISLPASWSLTMSSFSRASAAYSLFGKRLITSRSAAWRLAGGGLVAAHVDDLLEVGRSARM